jgi:hypothetical protein
VQLLLQYSMEMDARSIAAIQEPLWSVYYRPFGVFLTPVRWWYYFLQHKLQSTSCAFAHAS